MDVYFACLQSNTKQATCSAHTCEHTFGCNLIVPSRFEPVKLKDEQGLRAEILTRDNLWTEGLNGSVKHTHTNAYMYCMHSLPWAIPGLCSTEILLSGRKVIVLQEVTPLRGLPLSGSDLVGLCGESAGDHRGHITPAHMGPCSTGSWPAVNPLTSSSSAPVP